MPCCGRPDPENRSVIRLPSVRYRPQIGQITTPGRAVARSCNRCYPADEVAPYARPMTSSTAGARRSQRRAQPSALAVALALVSAASLGSLTACAPAGLRVDSSVVVSSPTSSAPTAPTAPAAGGPTRTSTPTPSFASIRSINPRAVVLADKGVPVELREALTSKCLGCLIDTPVYGDITGDGAEEILLPIYDGSHLAGTVVYTMTVQGPQRIFAHYGHEGWVEIVDSDLVLTRRMYAADDAKCCATGPDEISHYGWQNGKLVLTYRAGGGVGFTPYEPKDRVIV